MIISKMFWNSNKLQPHTESYSQNSCNAFAHDFLYQTGYLQTEYNMYLNVLQSVSDFITRPLQCSNVSCMLLGCNSFP